MTAPMLDRLIDWDIAAATARRLSRPGPQVSPDEARQVVEQLRACAAAARPHVEAITGMHAPDDDAVVLVVDRPGWVRANLETLRAMLGPVVDKLLAKRPHQPSPLVAAVGGKVTGAEAGGLLAFLSGKVLGQYDIAPGGTPRLLLVAPNVVQAEREMGVDPDDFRLWVCLHEETHRVQFTAVPWLRSHLLSEMEQFLDRTDLDPAHLAEMLRHAIEQIGRLVRGDSDVSLLDVLQTPEQRAIVERLTAVMSLLEGHADVVMDGVGPHVVPSVESIRAKFNARRAGSGGLDRLIRKLLGF